MAYFPINIDLSKLIISETGGGEVATRKVQNLIEFSAKPTIIAPVVTIELQEIINLLNHMHLSRKHERGDANQFDMIFVTTDDDTLVDDIIEDVRNRNLLIDFADKPAKCNFFMPSFFRPGDLFISISTQVSSPFLSKYIREFLEKKFPHNYADFVELSMLFRSMLLRKKIDEKQSIIEGFLEINWLKILCKRDLILRIN